MTSKTGQGLIAFALGTAGTYVLGFVCFSQGGIGGFLNTNLMYIPRTPWPWSTSAVLWGYASSMISGLIMLTTLTALVVALLILAFRRLGVKPKWSALKDVFIWAIVANTYIFLLSYALLYTGDGRTPSVWIQTLAAYGELLMFGLPYTFAWLWATRKSARPKLSTKRAR